MTARLVPRSVAGIAAAASAASPAVTPGMTRNGTPAAASVVASSPPRPNTNGSPPLSRNTRLPARASATRRWLISAFVHARLPPRLPGGLGRAPRAGRGRQRAQALADIGLRPRRLAAALAGEFEPRLRTG